MKLSNGLLTLTSAVVVLMLSAVSVQASAIYNFVGTGLPNAGAGQPSEPVAFQLTVANFLNPPLDGSFVIFTCAQLDSSTNCDPQDVETFSTQTSLGAFSAQLTFDANNNVEYGFFFSTGAFGAPGVYSAETTGNDNPGVLSVTPTTDSGALTQAPEPTTILLALSGFCFCRVRRLLTKCPTAS
jgi:hypothetical protein